MTLLTSQLATSFLALSPTEEERKLLAPLLREDSILDDLMKADRFLVELLKTPRHSTRLFVIQFMHNFNELASNLHEVCLHSRISSHFLL